MRGRGFEVAVASMGLEVVALLLLWYDRWWRVRRWGSGSVRTRTRALLLLLHF
jgi:hypothetical protein